MNHEHLKESWADLKAAAKTPEGLHMLCRVLNDLRARYELSTPQTVHNADGSLNAAASLRKATAFEMHQIYSALTPEGEALCYDNFIPKQ